LLRFKELQMQVYVEQLISMSYDNWRTNKYDYFQRVSNGIAP